MDRVRQGKPIDIEEALLIYSELHNEEDIKSYHTEISQLDFNIGSDIEQKEVSLIDQEKLIRVIHDSLWKDKPDRYNGNFLLKDVVEAQLSPSGENLVGNCLGLTSLFTVLGERYGLDISITLTLQPNHVFSCMNLPKGFSKRKIYIENTDPKGFDVKLKDRCKEHNLREEDFIELDIKGLMALVLNSRALEKRKKAIEECNREYLFAALNDYLMALELNDQQPFIYSNLARLKADMGYPDEAIKEIEKAIELAPNFGVPYARRGLIRQKQGDLEEALKDFSTAVQCYPENSGHHFDRGVCNMKLENYEEAIKDFDKTLELEEDFAAAYDRRARAKIALKDIEGARDDFKAVTELELTNVRVYRDLAWTRLQLGDIEGAIEDIDWMIDNNPENYSLYLGRANLKKKIDDIAGALSDYDIAEELYKKSKAQ